jgi:gliding motility-associated-like protein
MKHFYKLFKGLFIPLLLLFYSQKINAQTTLAAGDLAFTGYDSNISSSATVADAFSFVVLKNISAGTIISFSDRGYFGYNTWQSAGSTEASISWTIGSAIPAGTEVLIRGLVASTYNPATTLLTPNGTVVPTEGNPINGLSLSNVGDQIIAFQGGGGSISSGGITIIAGIHYFYCSAGVGTTQVNWDDLACADGPNSSVIPPGLTGGMNAFYTGVVSGTTVSNSAVFNGAGAPFANATAARIALMNQGNWTRSTTGLTVPTGYTFISSATAITTQPSASILCVGGNTSFSIVASNASSYQWQVSTNSGTSFSNIVNVGIYSGATTATLTITGATMGMSGYLYRCIATGTSSVNSNAATLTINSAPSIIAQPSDRTICAGSNTTFSVTASNATGYQWQVNNGSGPVNIANGGVYSGATTSTLTITGATGLMNNLQYRLIATGSCTPSATSNSATLKVSNIQTAASQTNIACKGSNTGQLSVFPNGGIGVYTYLWSNGATTSSIGNLVAGTYSVSVKDESLCEKVLNFTITEPSSLSATTASTGVSCFGGSNGSASVTVSGGKPAYTYQWAPLGGNGSSITGRPAGDYTCTITDGNGCTLVKNVTISTPPVFSATYTKTNVSCNGGTNGTATITAMGGTGPYTYSWSPSGRTGAVANGLSAGDYRVTIKDANTCTYTVDITINEPALLTAVISKTDVLCNGGASGTATVMPSGGTSNYTYFWSPSGGTAATATGLTIGKYSCEITDANGCHITKEITINQPSILTATTSQINATCSTGGQASVTPSGGASPYTYLWSPSGATTQLVTGLVAGNHSVVITDANGCTLTKNFLVTTTNTLIAATSQTDILCNGAATGSASVVPSGAPGPFTYVWSPSGGNTATATNLTAGNYSVTITSANGCSIIKNFTITQPPALFVSAGAQTNIICNGGSNGSASVSTTGGTGAYTYAWAPSGGTAATATGLSAGTYTVTVTDANLCSKTQSFTITQPAALVASIGAQTNVLCNGGTTGSATVSVTGGTGAYTYLWAPSGGTAATASGLAAGTYTVTVKDANLCQTTQTFTISQPASLSIIPSQTNVQCFGTATGTASVNVTGGTSNYTYEWSPSGGTGATATGLVAGNYSVKVTDANGCFSTENFTITQPVTALTVIPGGQSNILCNGGNNGSATVVASGGTGTYTYSWAPSGGNAATANGLSAGIYTVTVTDANLCSKTQSFTITEPSVLTATSSSVNTTGYNVADGEASVVVTGGTGAYTYTWLPVGGTGATATGLLPGTYTVTITDANRCQLQKSITIVAPSTTVSGNVTALNTIYGSASTSGSISVSGVNLTSAISINAPSDFELSLDNVSYKNPISLGNTGNLALTTVYVRLKSGLNVGAYLGDITISSNGALTKSVSIPSSLVEKKELTLSLNASPAITKVYDGVNNATLQSANYSLNGLIAGDVITVNGVANYDDASAGVDKLISVSRLSLNGGNTNNYYLATATVNTTGTITSKTITVTAVDKTKTYGDADPALTYTFLPALVAGDTFTGSLSRPAGEDVGMYSINKGTLALNGNYNLTYNGAGLSIIPKTITVTAVDKTKTYGDADPALTYTFLPALVAGDTFTGSLSRAAGEDVGMYSINKGTLALNGNYNLAYNGAGLSIGAKTITVTAVDKTKTYGDADPALTYTFLPGLIASDTFTGSLSRVAGEDVGMYSINKGTLVLNSNYILAYNGADLTIGVKTINVTALAKTKTYGDVDPTLTYTFLPTLVAGDTFTGSLSRSAGEDVGMYSINKGTLALNGNYNLAYNGAGLSIGAKTITVTAVDKTKTYGDADPALTYTFLPGLIASDTFTGSLSRSAGEDVGMYSINKGTLALNGNYNLAYNGADLSIIPKTITVTAVDKTKTYGDADPALTYTFLPALVSGDTFTGSLSRVAGVNAGIYTITQNTLSLNNNYKINYTAANLVIGKAILNVVVSNTQMCQSGNLPVFNLSYSGFKLNDNENNLSTKPTASTLANVNVPGVYVIGLSGGVSNNYNLSYTNGQLTIVAAYKLEILSDKGNTISKGDNIVLTVNGGAGTYVWRDNKGVIFGQNSSVLTARPSENQIYTVSAVNSNGCNYETSISININEDFKIKPSNILTPNGDGVNDFWIIQNIDMYPKNEVKIFDKSGRILYTKKGYDNTWNGTVNGLQLQEGTYFYVIDYGTDKGMQKGFITILK